MWCFGHCWSSIGRSGVGFWIWTFSHYFHWIVIIIILYFLFTGQIAAMGLGGYDTLFARSIIQNFSVVVIIQGSLMVLITLCLHFIHFFQSNFFQNVSSIGQIQAMYDSGLMYDYECSLYFVVLLATDVNNLKSISIKKINFHTKIYGIICLCLI